MEDCPWILVGRGVGGHWKDPVPQVQQSRGGGRQGRVALEGGGVSPGRYGSSGGSEGAGEEQRQGRQRLHTRLYPVEISRALKSSESMLPVCFCSQDAGIAEARPRVGPMCTADRQHSGGGSRETGGPETQVRGKVSRDVRKEAREPGRQHMMRRNGEWEGEERERRAVNSQSAGPQGAYLPVVLHVVAQADEAGLELLRPQGPAMVLPGGHPRQATEVGEGPGHMQWAGEEDTWGRETHS